MHHTGIALNKSALNQADYARSASSWVDNHQSIVLLNEGGWGNGNVHLHVDSQSRHISKTYRHRNWLVRKTIGRWLIHRERQAYERLADLHGVAKLHPGGDAVTLNLEYVQGRSINQVLGNLSHPIVHRRLSRLINLLHERGVYHLDLRNRGNVLVDRYGHITLIDFASAITVSGNHWAARLIKRVLRVWDLYGIDKWSPMPSRKSRWGRAMFRSLFWQS